MMIQKKVLKNNSICLLVTALLIVSVSCSPGMRLLNKIPVHSVKVKVADAKGNPVRGAQVMASNGRKTTTNKKGIAEVRFGSVGLYTVTVVADNYMPSNFVVTMPVDDGELFKRQISLIPTFSRLRFGMMSFYPFLYNYMLSSFGYSINMEPYTISEYTVWEMTNGDEEESIIMKKAFLKENKEGQKWWRVVIKQEDSKYVAEILFSADRTRILRYRERIDGGEVKEKPVSKNWYSKPIELTDESVQGATTKENISVKTPAGTFTADLLKFGPTPGTTLKIWKTPEVPGGVVKYISLSDGEIISKSVLIKFGSGAETKLDSY